MKKTLAIVSAAVIALTLGGCVSDAHVEEKARDTAATQVITVEYKGKPLDCITWTGYAGEVGMTCDFVKYHAENE